ncbi:DUF2730 family protein [Phocoenobacter skyensis]|uniref:DUF2730 family protein n=1 Tax=Phocoenobacter skyensis TaxID=97481 RepID=A0ABT9JKR5_9PAST|nr:DUF2730 family protein [Pasteurella skyensis]MDP8079529.1 DUF2730 family protein [Pasteurella skyensis]MDP8085401.1 DUF2730 family protein [Pasteurella skyensis]
MIELIQLIKEYWAVSIGVATFIGSLVWLKLDARYAKKNDISELRGALNRIEGTTIGLQTNTKNLQDMVQLLLKKELKENE